jgi:hypothetical protein
MNENGDLYHYLQKKYIEIKIAVFITDQGKMSSFPENTLLFSINYKPSKTNFPTNKTTRPGGRNDDLHLAQNLIVFYFTSKILQEDVC